MSKVSLRVDPIEALRNAYLSKKTVTCNKGNLVIEKTLIFPMNTPTAWISPLSGKRYSLGSLWLFMESEFARVKNYMDKVFEHEVEPISVADKE